MKLIALAVLTFLIGVSSFPNTPVFISIAGLASDRDIDVYTQYPAPYGGQGRNMPSNPFRPMTQVLLYAYITYNSDPVAQKIVTFRIEHGEWDIIRTSATNSSGMAWVKFTIPWPDTDPEARVLGIWNVTATVDIRDIVVVDELWFYASLTDLNCDGKVDGKDMAIVAQAFGSYPGHPKWNPIADINLDNRVDGRDTANIAQNFGQRYL